MIELGVLLVLVAVYVLLVVPILATIAFVKIRRMEREKEAEPWTNRNIFPESRSKAPLPRFYRPSPTEPKPMVGPPPVPAESELSAGETHLPPTDPLSMPPPIPRRESKGTLAGGGEIAWIARWAPVIGAIFGIGALVFFGLYITQETSPLIRFLQLLAISAGLYGGGLVLQRYRPTFSAIVTGMGLAALFFTAIAGYALPPVQVFENLVWAAVAQILVLLWGFRESLRLKTPALGTGMVGLGAISCILLFIEGLFAGILPALFFLFLIAFGLLPS